MFFLFRVFRTFFWPILTLWAYAQAHTQKWVVDSVAFRNQRWVVTVHVGHRYETHTWVLKEMSGIWRCKTLAPFEIRKGARFRFLEAAVESFLVADHAETLCAFCEIPTAGFCDALTGSPTGEIRACGAKACKLHRQIKGDFLWCPRHWHTQDPKHIHPQQDPQSPQVPQDTTS